MGQRLAVPRFVGGSNRLVSPQASNEATINRFTEITRDAGGKVQRYLCAAEGIRPFALVDDVDCVGQFAQDNRAWAVTGTQLVEFFQDGTVAVRGTVEYDGTPVTMVSTGSASNQLAICAGKKYYVLDLLTDAFTGPIDVDSGKLIRMIEYLDGYVHLLVEDSDTVYYSDLFDAATIDPLSFYKRNWGSDNIAFIKRSGRFLYIIGTKTGEIWADNGDAEIPFAPVQGTFLDVGCIAPFSAQRNGKGINWLMGDERGGGIVVRSKGSDVEEFTTYPISALIQSVMPTGPDAIDTAGPLSQCTAFVYQRNAHQFYWLHVPGLDTTPVFDATENEWAERAMWQKTTGVFIPHVARTHCFAFERHFVGVKTNGVIYELSPAYRFDRLVA